MKTWLRRLAGLIDVVLGLVIVSAIVWMSMSAGSETGTGVDPTDIIWGVVGAIILLAGVGILLHRGWGRVLGILLALIYILICSAFFASRGLNLEPGREGFRTSAVIATGVSQLFVLLTLLAAWQRDPQRSSE